MKVAVVQLNANENKEQNINKAIALTKRAIRAKAKFILLPEAFCYRGRLNHSILSSVAENIPGVSTQPFRELAKQHNVFILAGSVCERSGKRKKAYNTSALINSKGKVAAKYRKINLFDAVVNKKVLKESKNFLAGKKAATARVMNFKVGLTVCYDLRFPKLYQRYAKQGCHVLAVPSAFTKKTGEAHWETLLRARAIENLCYVLAPNQNGKDRKGVQTYGNSMIISPWGTVLARASSHREEIIYANIEMKEINQAKAVLPSI